MKLIIPGQPQAKMRARTFKAKQGGSMTYDPQHVEKNAMRWKIKAEMNKQRHNEVYPAEGAVIINMHFYIQPSLSDPSRNLKLHGLIPHTQKPDKDNLEKFILDCANKILYHDDSQVIRGEISKCWSDEPRTEIDMTIQPPCPLSPNELKILNLFSPEEFCNLQKLSEKISYELSYCSDPINWERLLPEMIELSKNYSDKFAKVKKIAKEIENENSTS